MSTQSGLRPWFDAYLAAFNRADYGALGARHADGVIFHGQAAQLVGRDAVLDFYRTVRTYLDERVDLLGFVGASNGPICAADRRRSVNFAMYEIANGAFTRVRTALFSPQAGAKA